jgi:hypothetical protein
LLNEAFEIALETRRTVYERLSGKASSSPGWATDNSLSFTNIFGSASPKAKNKEVLALGPLQDSSKSRLDALSQATETP